MSREPTPAIDDLLEYRAHAADLLALVLAAEGRSDLERDALTRVGVLAANMSKELDALERVRVR